MPIVVTPLPLLSTGEQAPDFAVAAHNDETVRLSDYAGKYVVLWFYPAADTPGCTLEGKGFRDRIVELSRLQAVVLGASFDTIEANKAFAERFDFPFLLLCDTERDLGMKYRVAGDKQTSEARRVSYLIDPQGTIVRVYDKVDAAEHVDQVIADLETLAE